jgi:hypothetical protein
MPRSRGTAALEACLRSNDLHEAWNPRKFMSHDQVPPLQQSIDHLVSQQQIDAVLALIDQPDTKVKIMGQQLARLAAAQAWWATALERGMHDIYVLERPYEQSLDSWLLAEHLGYFARNQTTDREIIATDQHVAWVRLLLENHVRFYPSYGHRISWDALPPQAFDKRKIIMRSQHSLDRLRLIANLDWWHTQTKALLGDMQDQLDACRDRLPAWDDRLLNMPRGQGHG